jgi:hypothetical protein
MDPTENAAKHDALKSSCRNDNDLLRFKPGTSNLEATGDSNSDGEGCLVFKARANWQQALDLSQIAVRFISCMLYLQLIVRHVADLISGVILVGDLTIPSSSTASSSPFPSWFIDYSKTIGGKYHTVNDDWCPKLASVINIIPTFVKEEGKAEASTLAGPLAEVQLSSSKSLSRKR